VFHIRPISDLRNHYKDVEAEVNSDGPVFLTKNGYGSMVVMSIEDYSLLTDPIEFALDQADAAAALSSERLTHTEIFGSLRRSLSAKEAIQA
jgi:prevent-host-death family protein